MTRKKNFRWLENDIDSSLILRVVRKSNDDFEECGAFNIMDVLETTGDELEVITANIDDLTQLLTLGIVRFYNVSDGSDILDIPFRKLYSLYENGCVLGGTKEGKRMSFEELDAFSVIDGSYKNDYYVLPMVVDRVSDDLNEVMRVASEFGNYGMQQKFDALSKITLINHRRLINDEKARNCKLISNEY